MAGVVGDEFTSIKTVAFRCPILWGSWIASIVQAGGCSHTFRTNRADEELRSGVELAAIAFGKFCMGVVEAVEKLVEFPEMGRWVPEAGRADIRELIVLNYRVIYMVQDDKRSVVILAIVHGKRELAAQDKPPWNNPVNP